MRALLLAVLIPCLAHAEGDLELKKGEAIILAGVAGGALVTYGVYSTMMMMSDLFEKGYSEPGRTGPAGFIALLGLAASSVLMFQAGASRDEVGMVGAALGGTASLALCFFVALSVHGWRIRELRPGD